MPQMAPMNWLILFIYFIMSLYIIMNMMYFNFMKTPNSQNMNKMYQIKHFNKSI
uniref:ATP synthase complex subunit 8 n=1 Tax=Eriosoma lanuginosum TaxID=135953 RepID=A0A096VKB7_9HEMI|nr:ATP synthase F0 subunit 8 [Eriosoma lanuginosum]